ncbi:MAG: class II fructose-bisphosphate aldolase [Deltaproteobacteria bacterium]|nr:class II fructose-bisphosphate aldolase [Deltaproteobacteria bacterium]
MIFQDRDQLKRGIEGILEIDDYFVKVLNESKLRNTLIDDLIYTAVFCSDSDTKEAARWLIRRAGVSLGIISSSIQALYEAMGRKEVVGFTVPAINLRGITYYSAQAVFRSAVKDNVGALIFEIARSEIGYTEQRPNEYTAAVTAAAIKTGFEGPLFLQGDHFQINAKKFAQDPEGEVNTVKELIREAIAGGFYNIDIDPSTVVDLSKPTIKEQQANNYLINADLTVLIRSIEPKGITVSVGGEIGEVGGKNTTVEEFKIFMDNYLKELKKKGEGLKGISKISIQTGTTHGGVPLPDGSIAKVKIDFDTLESISKVARSEYGLSGAVQHGASTLPSEAFNKFPKTETAEIHLATGFQNIIYDSHSFPDELKDKVYKYINTELRGEKKEKDTEEQFIYKTRKKGFGPFKKDMWKLPIPVLESIGKELENQFSFLFDQLNVGNTTGIVEKHVKPVDVPLEVPQSLL